MTPSLHIYVVYNIERRCLEKDRELRYQHVAEIRTELKKLQRSSPGVIEAPAAAVQQELSNHPHSTLQTTKIGGEQFTTTLQSKAANTNWSRRWFPVLSALLVAAAALLGLLTRPVSQPKMSRYAQLTYDGRPEGPGRHGWFATLSRC
jgi:hypothetical protein